MNNQKLHYPINLHMRKSLLIVAMIGCLLLSLLGIWQCLKVDFHNDLNIFLLPFVILIIGAVGFIAILVIVIKNEPKIIIHPSSIELRYLSKENQQFLWSQVANVEIIKSKDENKRWWLVISHKQSDRKIPYLLELMLCNKLLLNEQEIFAIIEQSFQRKEPIYQQIKMTFRNQFESKWEFRFWIIMIVVFIVTLFVGLVMPIF